MAEQPDIKHSFSGNKECLYEIWPKQGENIKFNRIKSPVCKDGISNFVFSSQQPFSALFWYR